MAPVPGSLVSEGDEVVGQQIVDMACQAPLSRMLMNAGLSKEIINKVAVSKNENEGYNIKTRQFENLFDAGVLDPTKVIRCALQNAASVAGAVITSHCIVVEVPRKN